MDLTEAAMVDGASVWRQYWQIILPLCRPPMAALATLLFTWIYNDFFWAQVLMQSGDKRPITSAIVGLQGQFFTDNNLIAAASLVAALPTLIVYFALQRHFIGGLTLGATKG
jgi:multiple sugar transport system permease protein